ncbi:MAG TPA: Mur ligase domain-containing protein, partial [Cyclobacteriaceae bacterium]|nr:Mur ligase domain-containing protein [Cyclobacteriaceae bacterium]
MKLEQVHSVYFIGIGGIGMSALARWFMLQGKQVYGYDRTATLLTQELIQEGAHIHYTDDVAYVQSLALDKSTTMVIITPAVPKNHQEWQWFTANDYTIKKRSEVLGDITNTKFNIAVAGTHGKTTTSSMIAHIIKSSGSALAAF